MTNEQKYNGHLYNDPHYNEVEEDYDDDYDSYYDYEDYGCDCSACRGFYTDDDDEHEEW